MTTGSKKQEQSIEPVNKRVGKLDKPSLLRCGIIMPIASMGDYSEAHWQDVKSIITEATQQISEFTFKTEIVSNSDGEINIIHKNIITNIYNSDVVVCDISGRNPNVLFELGMRLTFDKPTIIIKDDETPYIFDTSSIETLTYPKDLRFHKIVSFKETLANRIKLTYIKSIEDKNYSPFLGHFGEFKVPVLNVTAVTEPQQIILDEISSLRSEIRSIKKDNSINIRSSKNKNEFDMKNNNDAIDMYLGLISDYLHETKDTRLPHEILESREFLNYSKWRNINHHSLPIPVNAKLKVITDFQNFICK